MTQQTKLSDEQLKELLSKITKGEWKLTEETNGFVKWQTIVDENDNEVASFPSYQTKDNKPYGYKTWGKSLDNVLSDASLFLISPSLATEVLTLREQKRVLREALNEGFFIIGKITRDIEMEMDLSDGESLDTYSKMQTALNQTT